jgi:hypothetical protein
MHRQGLLHMLVFVVFFGIGAAALGVSVLSDDLVRYCRNQVQIAESQDTLERLESLNRDYDVLLAQLEADPNLLKRIAPATLGTEPKDPCTIYPKARARELQIARKALLDQMGHDEPGSGVPPWLQRCSEPRRRMVLFVAGASLILISLVCFTPEPKQDA